MLLTATSLNTGLAVEENKEFKIVFSIENGLLHGPSITYVKRNSKEYLYEIGHFKRGEKHGVCCTYDKKGRLANLENHYNGRLEGSRIIFSNGRVRVLRNIENYNVTGIESTFSKEGVVSEQTVYDFDDRLFPLVKKKEDD